MLVDGSAAFGFGVAGRRNGAGVSGVPGNQYIFFSAGHPTAAAGLQWTRDQGIAGIRNPESKAP
jgi:hypothetical protein